MCDVSTFMYRKGETGERCNQSYNMQCTFYIKSVFSSLHKKRTNHSHGNGKDPCGD